MTTQAARRPYHGNSETRSADAASVPGSSDQARTTASQDAADYPVADWVDVAELALGPESDLCPAAGRVAGRLGSAGNKFLVTNYAGCHTVEQDQETFSANVSGATMTRAIGAQPMLRKDDPEHSVDRAPVNPVLRPKSLKEVSGPVFERNAETYLENVAELGPEEADLNRDLCRTRGLAEPHRPAGAEGCISGAGSPLVPRLHRGHGQRPGRSVDLGPVCDASTAEADA